MGVFFALPQRPKTSPLSFRAHSGAHRLARLWELLNSREKKRIGPVHGRTLIPKNLPGHQFSQQAFPDIIRQAVCFPTSASG